MKQLFLSIFILALCANESSAQWSKYYIGFDFPVAFGIHNGDLFASMKGSDVERYAPTTPFKWVLADTGMVLQSDTYVTAFGSIGSYFLAAVNSSLGGGAYRSSDNGSNWIPTNDPQSNCFLTWDKFIYSGGAGGVYRSDDSGMYWTLFSASQKGVNALAVNGTVLFEGTNSGIYFSTDGGNSWTQTSVTTKTSSFAVIGTITVAGQTNGGIYRSKDGGKTWSHDVTGLLNGEVNCIVTDGKNFFAGTGSENFDGSFSSGSGVFLSTDSGSTWDTVNTGLPEGLDGFLNISTLCVFDTLLLAGTWDNAGQQSHTYARPISEMAPKSAVAAEPKPSDTIELYPNPTTAHISILAGSTPILSVRVLNVLGTDILDIDEPRSANLTLDLSKLPSGTYFLQIETAKGTAMRKVVRE